MVCSKFSKLVELLFRSNLVGRPVSVVTDQLAYGYEGQFDAAESSCGRQSSFSENSKAFYLKKKRLMKIEAFKLIFACLSRYNTYT